MENYNSLFIDHYMNLYNDLKNKKLSIKGNRYYHIPTMGELIEFPYYCKSKIISTLNTIFSKELLEFLLDLYKDLYVTNYNNDINKLFNYIYEYAIYIDYMNNIGLLQDTNQKSNIEFKLDKNNNIFIKFGIDNKLYEIKFEESTIKDISMKSSLFDELTGLNRKNITFIKVCVNINSLYSDNVIKKEYNFVKDNKIDDIEEIDKVLFQTIYIDIMKIIFFDYIDNINELTNIFLNYKYLDTYGLSVYYIIKSIKHNYTKI